MRTDLDLSQLILYAEDRRVQRLIAVLLGRRDKILDTPILGAPERMDMTKRQVAFIIGIYQDAERNKIMHLAERHHLTLVIMLGYIFQFAIDACQMFLPRLHLSMNASSRHLFLQDAAHLFDVWYPPLDFFLYLARQPCKAVRVCIAQDEIFQLGLYRSHTKAP